jgi:Flp pilus assembly protein CpaB
MPPSPAPQRIKRPRWFDPRLLSGVALVLVCVLAGSWLVSSADHRVRMLVATRDLAAGTVLTANDVRIAAVQLGSVSSRYLPATTSVGGLRVRSQLSAGELLAREQIGPARQGVSLTISASVAASPQVERGDRVAIWVNSKLCRGGVVLGDVTVQAVHSAASGAFESASGASISVLVSDKQARQVLLSLALDSPVVRFAVLSHDQPGLNADFNPLACQAVQS